MSRSQYLKSFFAEPRPEGLKFIVENAHSLVLWHAICSRLDAVFIVKLNQTRQVNFTASGLIVRPASLAQR